MSVLVMLGCDSSPSNSDGTEESDSLHNKQQADVTGVDRQIHPFITSSFHQTCLALLSHSIPLTASFNRPPLALLYHIILTPNQTPLPIIHPGKGYSKLHYTSCLSVILSGLFSVSSLLSCPSLSSLLIDDISVN